MNEQLFQDTVSGRRRGLVGIAARAGLWLAQWPYAVAVGLRNRRYDNHLDAATRVAVPVVSVGNLTVGGTGKTPMVKWIARYFRQQEVRLAILSRGYGAEHGAKNDEAIELEQAAPDVPHLQDPDRVAMARVAIEQLKSKLLLLDDGFQHRRLARDLDIVLLDATNPFGHGHLLPRGLLREPIASLRRAQVVCLTRADLIDAASLDTVREQVTRHAPEALWCESCHRPVRLVNSLGHQSPLSLLSCARVTAFCGIGNPAAFHRTLGSMGTELTTWRPFPDHHPYSKRDIEQLASDAESADLLVCTMKDLAKVQAASLGGKPLWGVEIEMDLTLGRRELEEQLTAIALRASPTHA